jgi:hypothetical protein
LEVIAKNAEVFRISTRVNSLLFFTNSKQNDENKLTSQYVQAEVHAAGTQAD